MMFKKEIAYLLFGFVFGILLTFFVVDLFYSDKANMNVNDSNLTSHVTMTTTHHGTGMTMENMVSMLDGKTGDDFDKAFIEGMIGHHQGAIDMARLARDNAGQQEIKNLADEIISAQTNEINMMINWQKAWGY